MAIQIKLDRLQALYALYGETVAPFEAACRRGCSTCCTCNVTCTTLECWLMVQHLAGCGALGKIDPLVSGAPADRFQPAITVNQLAARCARGEPLPCESSNPGVGPCVWLADDVCPLYEVRPFACRAMMSSEPCRSGGEAAMPPFILSLNHVMMQYLEALDRPGASGNLVDIMDFFAGEDNRRAYFNQTCRDFAPPLSANRALPVLMVPPEHRKPLQPFFEKVQAIVR